MAATRRLDMKSTQDNEALIGKIQLNINPRTFLYIKRDATVL